MLRVGHPGLDQFLGPVTFSGAVLPLRAERSCLWPKQLDELGIVDLWAERVLYSAKIGRESVCGQLDAVQDSASNVKHEFVCTGGIALPNELGDNQLGVRIDGNPGPDIPMALFAGFFVLLLAAAESPDFVGL